MLVRASTLAAFLAAKDLGFRKTFSVQNRCENFSILNTPFLMDLDPAMWYRGWLAAWPVYGHGSKQGASGMVVDGVKAKRNTGSMLETKENRREVRTLSAGPLTRRN